jgi:hypothetical protein
MVGSLQQQTTAKVCSKTRASPHGRWQGERVYRRPRHTLANRCLQYVKHNEFIVGGGKKTEKAKTAPVQDKEAAAKNKTQ